MATTTRVVNSEVFGSRRVTVSTIALDSVYPTGGEAISAADLGLTVVDWAVATVKSAATSTVNVTAVHYETSTNKLLCYDETPAQVANAADLRGSWFRSSRSVTS